jgi:hypothetical protein
MTAAAREAFRRQIEDTPGSEYLFPSPKQKANKPHITLGKAIRTSFELRTNQDGEAKIPTIPQGQIQVQAIAKGYQTFGQIFG